MSHIVIDARIINSSTGRYVERLLYFLQEVDTVNQYTILVPEKDRDYWKPYAKNFSVSIADFKNYSLSEQTKFRKLLDNLKPDLVHFCMPQQPIFYKGKSVTTFHDLTLLKTYNSDKNWFMFKSKQLIGKYVFKKVATKSDHIITPSEFTKLELMKFAHIPASKITVTYESSDPFVGSVQKYTHPYEKYIMYVGQQSDYKNIKRLGDAHQKLLQKYPDLGLILVGGLNDSAKKNQTYFKEKGYKNILFTGFLPDRKLDYLYKNATAYIFPSLMEGFGLPGVEAMAHNLPVVSSNTTCLPEVYGDAAVYFNPLNTNDIADKIDEVLSSEKLRKKLIKNGQKQLAKYSWKKMAVETKSVYDGVLGIRD